ncbi:hypothetical protein [Nitrosomonas sp.]|uniref:hypothetical protein n=1 Tax=Nitrosomonas sp. TaxID=42353 RepID=UPI002727256A|nr:hypothetical protein [Nitrosomonas sp.]MDO8895557.1 hypothetical protein [Nitrosomonas sp.]
MKSEKRTLIKMINTSLLEIGQIAAERRYPQWLVLPLLGRGRKPRIIGAGGCLLDCTSSIPPMKLFPSNRHAQDYQQRKCTLQADAPDTEPIQVLLRRRARYPQSNW